MMKEYVLNKLECALLNEDKGTYELDEVKGMITTAIEDYQYEYELPVCEMPFKEVKQLFNRLHIQIFSKRVDTSY